MAIKSKLVAVRFYPQQVNKLRALSTLENTDISKCIRFMVDQYVQERTQKLNGNT